MSLASAALVSLLAFVAPLVVRLIRLPIPDIVVLILLGILLVRRSWAGPASTSPSACCR